MSHTPGPAARPGSTTPARAGTLDASMDAPLALIATTTAWRSATRASAAIRLDESMTADA